MTRVATIHTFASDDGEGLLVQYDGETYHVWTAYDCPEDNSVSRLGLEDLTRVCLETRPDRVETVVHDFDDMDLYDA